jgi:hypothetical protein
MTQSGGPPGSYRGLTDMGRNPIREPTRGDRGYATCEMDAAQRMQLKHQASKDKKIIRELEQRIAELSAENTKFRQLLPKMEHMVTHLEKRLANLETPT